MKSNKKACPCASIYNIGKAMKHHAADTPTARQPELVSQKQTFATPSYFIYTKEYAKRMMSVYAHPHLINLYGDDPTLSICAKRKQFSMQV